MPNLIARKIFFIFLTIGTCFSSYAQQIAMEIKKDTITSKQNLMDLVATLVNTSDHPFNGFLNIKTPEGFQSISGEQIDIHLDSKEKKFIPVKILFQQIAQAGTSQIKIDLLNDKLKIIQTESIGQTIEENNNLRLSTSNPMLFISNPHDSLSVQVTVSNLGNRRQNTSIIFSIPELTGEKNFFEKKGTVAIQQDTIFNFKFLPPQSLLDQPQFTINIAGMRGTEKELFGNLAITVQNISSNKRFQDMEAARQSQYYQRNSLTGSYRKIGANNTVYQLIGSGDINLPTGYLSVSGNIYQSDNANEPIISNTYLDYHFENHQLKIGNINQPLEMALFGRGIEIGTADKSKSKKIQIGFIDQNFNLIEKNSFLKYGYGVYATGIIGATNPSGYTSASYIFKEDTMEQTLHHLIGIDKAYSFNNKWRGNLKVYGGMSHYKTVNKNEASFALETQYNGEINGVKLSGNYFLSSAYFPGSRRGMIQIQQNFVKNISEKHTVYSSIFMSDFSPESHTYTTNMESTNFRFDSGINFARLNNTAIKLGYQYQIESSNSFGWNTTKSSENLAMRAHRLVENFNWFSKNSKHSLNLALEEGFAKLPNTDGLKPQFKFSTAYSFKWLTANVSYQYGSFFLSEYISTSRNSEDSRTFQRLISSVSIDKRLMNNKIFISSGAGYINDFTTGQTPSGFINLRYLPTDQYQIYLNSSWYRYDMRNNSSYSFSSSNNMFIIEAGLTIKFKGQSPSSGKKGTLTAQIYYDKNANNIFDEDDEIAADYLITINNTTFKTDSEGKLLYRSIPFGSYKLKPTVQKGWFTTGTEYTIDSYKTLVEIPLHQSGTASGKIQYEFDSKTVLDFEPKTGGIVFNISQNGKFIQRISTNDEGKLIIFLPTGVYQISLAESSLPLNAFCEEASRDFKIEPGKITHIQKFTIKVKEKTINIKRFGE
jgi:hypothetical protein